MSLSLKAIDRVFDRLAATYGKQFFELYAQVDPGQVRTLWGHEFSSFASPAGLKRIAWALENLPEKPPNAIQFRNLCRQAPAPVEPALPMPSSNPERMRAELAKLDHVFAKPTSAAMMDWAPRILARHGAGERITPTVLKMARDADAIRLRRGYE